MLDVDDDLSRYPPDLCPGCESSFQNVTSHWRQSAGCSEPRLQRKQHEVLAGALLVGGGIKRGSGEQPLFRMASTGRPLLEWLQDELGVFAGSIIEKSIDLQSSDVDRLSSTPTEAFNALYSLRSKTLRQLRPYLGTWYENGERSVPTAIQPTPRLLRTAFAIAGGMSADGRAYLSVTATGPPASTIERLFDGFAPRRSEHSSSIRVTLYNSTDFFDYIGDPPAEAVADPWPDELDEPSTLCPTCDARVDRLGTHWSKGPHDPPAGSDRQHEILKGMLLAGAQIIDVEGRTPRMQIASTSLDYLEWLADELGWLCASINEIEGEAEGVTNLRESFGSEATFTNTVWDLRTRSHPCIDALKRRLEGDLDAYFQETGLSPLALGVFYGRHGRTEDGRLHINTRLCPLADDVLADLFGEWEARIVDAGSKDHLRIPSENVDAFLEAVESGVEPMYLRQRAE